MMGTSIAVLVKPKPVEEKVEEKVEETVPLIIIDLEAEKDEKKPSDAVPLSVPPGSSPTP